MNDRRENRKKRNVLLALYLTFCIFIVVFAYFHLSKIARDYNTQHMELITGLYAEKMNSAMEYLQNYATEDAKLIEVMDQVEPEDILKQLKSRLDETVFFDIGLILDDTTILGSECAISDIKKKKLDEMAVAAESSFISEPYQSSETGTMIMTVFVPVNNSAQIDSLYVSIMIEDLRQLGASELLQGKIEVLLLKAGSENYFTCISNTADAAGNWNNLLLQQKYYKYYNGYSYRQWLKEMRAGNEVGRFSARIRDKDYTISYRSIPSMPGWYAIVQLANEDIADITRQFSIWGIIYGSILIGVTIFYMLTIDILERKDKKHYMGLSATDTLTGILNRSAFQRAVEEQIRQKMPGVLIFIDVDDFKKYNDTYGHQNGDFCLVHVAKTMKECFPGETILGRYGGDEFIAYLKSVTAKEVRQYMEIFKKNISHLQLPTGEKIHMSASAGGAAFPAQGEDYVSLCRCADVMLYDVKRNGKADFKMSEK